MIEHRDGISLVRVCKLLNINRSSIYYKVESIYFEDVRIMNEIRDIYEQSPFYGYRKIHVMLLRMGFKHNIKKTRRLMRLMNLRAIYPGKKTTMVNKAHKKYPYLLKDLFVSRINMVWKTDITYIKTKRGFIYLVCIIDVFSRKIMGWSISKFLETEVCIEAYEKAFSHGKPDILNSDQGCQFTSELWISRLEKDGIKISMDGKGRWADNIIIERFWRSIKYEAIFLNSLETADDARKIISEYIAFYNQRRPHQTLGYKTPDEVYWGIDDHIGNGLRPEIYKSNKFFENYYVIESACKMEAR